MMVQWQATQQRQGMWRRQAAAEVYSQQEARSRPWLRGKDLQDESPHGY